MTTNVDVPGILTSTGALLEGHFLLSSGRHSPQYMEKFRILQRPRETEAMCEMIADAFRNANVQAVAGPTLGGVIISYEVARKLGVRVVYAEAGDGVARVFCRDFESVGQGERILVVDDVLTTGGSVNDVIDAVKRNGGSIVGVGILIDRASKPVDFGVPFYACYEQRNIPSFAAEECPQCASGLTVVKPGTSAPK